MVADFFISAHRRDMLGKLYVRRGGHFTLNFLLNLTTMPLGVVELLFYFVGACTCTKSAIIYGSGFFISAHRRDMLGELYIRRGGRFTPNFLLNLTTTPLGVVDRYFYFFGGESLYHIRYHLWQRIFLFPPIGVICWESYMFAVAGI